MSLVMVRRGEPPSAWCGIFGGPDVSVGIPAGRVGMSEFSGIDSCAAANSCGAPAHPMRHHATPCALRLTHCDDDYFLPRLRSSRARGGAKMRQVSHRASLAGIASAGVRMTSTRRPAGVGLQPAAHFEFKVIVGRDPQLLVVARVESAQDHRELPRPGPDGQTRSTLGRRLLLDRRRREAKPRGPGQWVNIH